VLRELECYLVKETECCLVGKTSISRQSICSLEVSSGLVIASTCSGSIFMFHFDYDQVQAHFVEMIVFSDPIQRKKWESATLDGTGNFVASLSKKEHNRQNDVFIWSLFLGTVQKRLVLEERSIIQILSHPRFPQIIGLSVADEIVTWNQAAKEERYGFGPNFTLILENMVSNETPLEDDKENDRKKFKPMLVSETAPAIIDVCESNTNDSTGLSYESDEIIYLAPIV